MKGLKVLFIRKIIITMIFLCIPLLFFPASLFVSLGIPAPRPMLFARLLGVAYFALLIGYYNGIKALDNGRSPLFAVDMGIASNGLGGLVLLYFGLTGSWSGWDEGARVYMWLITLGALLITFNLRRARKIHGTGRAIGRDPGQAIP